MSFFEENKEGVLEVELLPHKPPKIMEDLNMTVKYESYSTGSLYQKNLSLKDMIFLCKNISN